VDKTPFHIILIFIIMLCACTENNDSPEPPPVDSGDNNSAETYTYKQTRSVKRGLCFNTMYTAGITAIKTGVSWCYNWDTKYSSSIETAITAAAIDYIPMAWNGNFNAGNIRAHKTQHPECQYILAFNEPNMTEQANMTPAQAAQQWPALKSLAQELNMKIVAPAVNYGTLSNYGDPIVWLDAFFQLVPLADVDAIAIHCYMNEPSAVKWYVKRFRKYNKPLWMTEFCAWEGANLTLAAQHRYMCEVVNYFEAEPLIARYAWFMFDGAASQYPYYALNGSNKLTDLGTVYVNLSSQDKNTRYAANEVIPAEHYSRTNHSEVIGAETWADGVLLNVSTDKSGILEVSAFSTNKWLEYQINLPEAKPYTLHFRYAAASMSYCSLKLGNTVVTTLQLPATGSFTKWSTYTETVNLPAGQQTLRFTMSMGEISMNWWKLVL